MLVGIDKDRLSDSSIILFKSKFFVYRVLVYFSFLLIPIWIQKSLDTHIGFQALIMVFYIFFMIGQWYMIGKEVDHRFKIYYRVNSSMDRVAYRLISGQLFFVVLFNVYSFIPTEIVRHFFWGTWVVLGLFYSWPTRGKIIRESVSSNFSEFRFLDSFEKTLVISISIMFIFSTPEIPSINSLESLKLYFDPTDRVSREFWTYLYYNFFPFYKFPQLMKVGWFMYFYLVGMFFFLLCFYALSRFFFSRRLALLGIFSIVSSWSFSKILGQSVGFSLSSTYSVIWIWSILWTAKSSTYRTGLFAGLVTFWGTLINQSFIFLAPILLLLVNSMIVQDKNIWFRRQWLKYASFGLVLSVLIFMIDYTHFDEIYRLSFRQLVSQVMTYLERKAFFILAYIGLPLFIYQIFTYKVRPSAETEVSYQRYSFFSLATLSLLGFSFVIDSSALMNFSLIWIISFFSLVPLEQIFKSLVKLRSKRNIIFMVYILICLLDSHFEGRVKIFLKLFN